MTRSEYISTHENAVIRSTMGTGLFPSVMMAQAAIESGNGKSTLAAKYNNHFGIKAGKSWKGKSVVLATKEEANGQMYTINDSFRVYPSALASFRDRNRFLKVNPRYKAVFTATTPEAQAWALQNAGYATATNYAESIISVIEANNLRRLDQKKNSTK
jgi:flagellum-specific peptidoglycan hydrolase FlgJ